MFWFTKRRDVLTFKIDKLLELNDLFCNEGTRVPNVKTNISVKPRNPQILNDGVLSSETEKVEINNLPKILDDISLSPLFNSSDLGKSLTTHFINNFEDTGKSLGTFSEQDDFQINISESSVVEEEYPKRKRGGPNIAFREQEFNNKSNKTLCENEFKETEEFQIIDAEKILKNVCDKELSSDHGKYSDLSKTQSTDSEQNFSYEKTAVNIVQLVDDSNVSNSESNEGNFKNGEKRKRENENSTIIEKDIRTLNGVNNKCLLNSEKSINKKHLNFLERFINYEKKSLESLDRRGTLHEDIESRENMKEILQKDKKMNNLLSLNSEKQIEKKQLNTLDSFVHNNKSSRESRDSLDPSNILLEDIQSREILGEIAEKDKEKHNSCDGQPLSVNSNKQIEKIRLVEEISEKEREKYNPFQEPCLMNSDKQIKKKQLNDLERFVNYTERSRESSGSLESIVSIQSREIDEISEKEKDIYNLLEEQPLDVIIADEPIALGETKDFIDILDCSKESIEVSIPEYYIQDVIFEYITDNSKEISEMSQFSTDNIQEEKDSKHGILTTVGSTEACNSFNDVEASLEEMFRTPEMDSCKTQDTLNTLGISNKRELKKRKRSERESESASLQQIKLLHEVKKEEFEQQKLKVLKLDIKIPWRLPLIHRIASHVSTRPTSEQRKALTDAGIQLKFGKYTKEEDDNIRKNWRLFCELHHWDENYCEPFTKGSDRSRIGSLNPTQFQKFVQFISHGFEDRLMYYTYLRFKRLFSHSDTNSGKFTSEDDEIILEFMENKRSRSPFVELARILKRDRFAISKRYKLLNMVQIYPDIKIKWKEKLAEQFINNLLVVTKCSELVDLKDRGITTEEWEKVSEIMELPPQKLKRAWVHNFHPRIFVPSYKTKIAETKKKLVNLLYKYKDWREIDWVQVEQRLSNGLSHIKLCKLFRDFVRSKVPKKKQHYLHDALKYLRKTCHYDDGKQRNRFNYVGDILETLKHKKELNGGNEYTHSEDED